MLYVKMASRTLLCNLCFDARSVICLLADNRPISFPVSSLPLSSETGNKDRNHQFLISVLLCLREVLYPFNQETFPREFCLDCTLVHARSKAVFFLTFLLIDVFSAKKVTWKDRSRRWKEFFANAATETSVSHTGTHSVVLRMSIAIRLATSRLPFERLSNVKRHNIDHNKFSSSSDKAMVIVFPYLR